MRKGRWMPVWLALAAVMLTTATARAEIIDYNPLTTEPPTILSPAELARYDQLIQGGALPSITTSGFVPGQYVMIRVSGQYQILDTRTEKAVPLDLAGAAISSAYLWTGPNTLVFYGSKDRQPAKVTVDLAAGTVAASNFTPAVIEGKDVYLVGRLIQTADGAVHMMAYTNTRGAQLRRIEPPTYDPRSRDELERVNQAEPAVVLAPNDEQIVAISLEDGHVTPIGTVPAGSNVGGAATSVGVRPGTNVAAYVVGEDIPWTGIVVAGRANRGGYMPTSYYNTQENLGLVPEAENRWLTGRSLHLVDMGTGQEVKAIENVTQPGGMFGSTFWTADGKHLVVRTYKPLVLQGRRNPIYEYYAGLKLRLYAPDGTFEREWDRPGLDGGPGFGPTTASVMIVTNPENLSRSVYLADLAEAGKAPLKVYDGSDQVYLFNYAIAGDKVVAVRGDATDFGDMYIGDTGQPNSAMRRFTNLNAGWKTAANIKSQPITYQTSSGFTVTGAYIYPADMPYPPTQPMPVVVWQQGGPGGQMVNTYGLSVESPYTLLPAYGIPVFMVNGAGRTSNGAAFYSAMADGKNYGTRDILDVKEGVDYLVAQKIADPKKVGVTGCSYGGYFTLQSITQLPDYYAAANTQCSLNDVAYEYNFGWSPFMAYLVGASTTGDPREYMHDSPQYNAYKVKTPLLIFHGTSDFLPFEHLTNFHDQVLANGTPTTFFRVYGQGHGFGGSSNGVPTGARAQRYGFQLQLSWFREHLGITTPRFHLALPGLGPNPIGQSPWR